VIPMAAHPNVFKPQLGQKLGHMSHDFGVYLNNVLNLAVGKKASVMLAFRVGDVMVQTAF
jgi:hypothetical protein